MYKPKLVLFDFGGTLIIDSPFSANDGLDALRLAADNPEVTTTGYMCELWQTIDSRVSQRGRSEAGYTLEIQLSGILRNIFALTGLRYSISLTECEIIFDRFNATRTATPHMAELLKTLNSAGIKTAVISNTVLSGEAMAIAIKEQLPESKMEFILTSADYLFCKPAPDMFLAAGKKAGVEPGECWYCGDSLTADVGGAHNSGILPVLYDSKSDILFECKEHNGKEYYTMNSWAELIKQVV